MVVSSLHDGMNLVAKEYVASRVDNDGALVLSSFTGAGRELSCAYAINPYHPEDIADAIFQALETSPRERAARMKAMRSWIQEHNIFYWAGDYLRALMHLPMED
jgi:trehalose 6-phosphate synthase